MIHNVVPVIAGELNNYLANNFDFEEAKVIVSNLVNQDGGVAFEGTNKLVCTLVNIEEDQSSRASRSGHMQIGNAYGESRPYINLNLKVLFSAHFSGKNYPESLKIISYVISFFQRKSVFTPNNTPRLTKNAERLSFDMVTLEMNEISHLWGMMGAKYVPSVLYKVQMLSFRDNMIYDEIPGVTGFEITGLSEKN
ncbi:hypothetical protein FUAX_24410 [Fulvitalea axinellae]|uniref:Pvc16 N-terminal domain-containing protein n=1 Tax=Fulvitalea axinellae TaxID=1182444 RepID=A0AAU9D678_9BACT|nr:hypothetical protein FUAX_24410 [Fulvitalea axinellae]